MKILGTGSATLLLVVCVTGFSFQSSGLSAFVGNGPGPAFMKNATPVAPLQSKSKSVAEKKEETFEFQADVGRVMDIIVNSLYSDKDIFLRELVSNAADACDKKRFLSITANKDAEVSKPQIQIKADEDNKIITIEDSGVGMTRNELINNLGRIAQSGTSSFLEACESKDADINLIGQFGVGFYSSYLVADKVEVISKSMQPGSTQFRWESDSGSSFIISDADDVDTIEGSGTRIILHLKDNALHYLKSNTLDELLQRYSEFVEFPISLWKETTDYEKVPDDKANKDLKEGDEPKMKTVPITKQGYEQLNNQKPIWLRTPKEVEEEEYKEFYKSAFRVPYDDPQKWSHFALEGQVNCKALLYIPGMLPFDRANNMFDENNRNIRLYVKRVFINDKFEDIMPRWLSFVRGVVDSDDLPLNVSREILQRSKVLNIINKRLVRKSIDMIRDLAKDEDGSKYTTFWSNFGKYLKVGAMEDNMHRNDIVPLLRFYSSKSSDKYTSLNNYVDGMPADQKSIYYVTGEGLKKTMLQPVIEKLSSRGYEVLFMTETLDEIAIEAVRKYKDFDIVDASKEGLDIEKSEDSKKKNEELKNQHSTLIEYLQTELSERIEKVIISTLLTDSPAALVQGVYGVSPTMQRYMKQQSVAAGGEMIGLGGGMNKATLEVNPNHPILQDLEKMIKENTNEVETKNFAMLIYDVASMKCGYDISDIGEFASRVMSLMGRNMKNDRNEEAERVKEGDESIDVVVPEVVK